MAPVCALHDSHRTTSVAALLVLRELHLVAGVAEDLAMAASNFRASVEYTSQGVGTAVGIRSGWPSG